MANNKKYMWIASSDDGAFEDKSQQPFNSPKDAYNDMREHALNKMKWNTQYDEDFNEEEPEIGYEVTFTKDTIIHKSYSGTYTYKVKEYQEETTARIIIDFDLVAPDKETLELIEDNIRQALLEESRAIQNVSNTYVNKVSVQGVQHIG